MKKMKLRWQSNSVVRIGEVRGGVKVLHFNINPQYYILCVSFTIKLLRWSYIYSKCMTLWRTIVISVKYIQSNSAS